MSCTKNPPKLEDESEYEMWRKNIEVWVELTDLPEEKRALAIHMFSLKGRAQAASSQLTVAEMKETTGVKKILDKLDKLYLSETGHRQFSTFRGMYRMKREPNESIDEFISRFEHQQYKLSALKVDLPDTCLAFLLLESCNMEEKQVQLILSSMVIIAYEPVKAALRRVFGGKLNLSENKSIPVKEEPILFEEASEEVSQDTFYVRGRGRGANRGSGSWRNRGGYRRGGYNSTSKNSFPNRKTNPVNYKGEVMKCNICQSIYHFARDCQHAKENQNDEEKFNASIQNKEDEIVHLSLFVGFSSEEEKSSNLSKLVEDSSCSAIVDCGASASVCGKFWLEDYLKNLSEYERGQISEKESKTSFTFGDGKSYQSLKCVTLPCYIGKNKANITTDVVECNVPLLLSKKALKKGKMSLDFENDIMRIGSSTIPLEETRSGHYKLPLKL